MAYITYSPSEYILSKKTTAERLEAVELLIDTYIASMADSVSGAGNNISEYWLDDSQVKIKTVYRSIEDIKAGLHALEVMRNKYLSQLTGRQKVCKDIRTFR
jgi:hypothetical protein